MLFHMKDHKAAVLENDLNKLQKDGPAAWADLPEDELFTPAGFSEERAEATSYSNYSYWGSTFRAFFKNKIAVALLIALVFVVGFAFLQPYLPGQADPNLCQVDPATGIQFRNIAPGEEGFIWGSNAIGQDLWARIWAGARTSLTIAFFVALIEAVVGITVGVLWGYVRQLDFSSPSCTTSVITSPHHHPDPDLLCRIPQHPDPDPGHVHHGLDRHGALYPQPDPDHPRP